jgi:hypothetical protein
MSDLDKRLAETCRVLTRAEISRWGTVPFGSISDTEAWRRLESARCACPMVGAGWTRITRSIFVRLCGWIQDGLPAGGRRHAPGAESGPTVSRRACPTCPSGAAVRRYRDLLEACDDDHAPEVEFAMRNEALALYRAIEPPAGMAIIGPAEVRERQRRGGFGGVVGRDRGLIEAYRYTIDRVMRETGRDY